MGNRAQKTDSAAGTTSYTYDAANRLTSTNGQSVTSDADGNTLTDASGCTNTWDSQNRLVSCTKGGTTSTYTYGADGLRRTSTVNGTTTYYVYDGTMMVREMQKNAQGVLQSTATYLCGPRGPEYRRDDTQAEGTYKDASGTQQPAGKTRWYVYDGLGSVVGEVDPSGNLTSSGTFDVYGAKRQGGTGAATSRQGFVGALGHVSDTETGLVYMRARYYDPNVGRFVSEDPQGSGNNWFIYCDNNPVNNVDSNGKVVSPDIEGVLKILYALADAAFNLDLGFDPTDNLDANLEAVKYKFEQITQGGENLAVKSTEGADGGKGRSDQTGATNAEGSMGAGAGMTASIYGSVAEEQIKMIEAWVDYVK